MNRTIEGYKLPMKRMQNLHTYRTKLGISQNELARISGVSARAIWNYEYKITMPTIKSYNKLCKVFNWPRISLPSLEAEEIVEPIKFVLQEGSIYKVAAFQSQEDIKFLFRYEGKKGIHHIFREIRGNWTRTYTDAQLVGRKVKEARV